MTAHRPPTSSVVQAAVTEHSASPMVFFSIVSANYLAYAITLMQSVREHHPDARRYVFLADERPAELQRLSDLFEIVVVREIGIPHFEHFAMRYSVLELNTATKPFALGWLAQRHSTSSIVYLDPDILVVSPLDAVTELLSSGSLAILTPHLTGRLADDRHPDELTFLRVGAYNLGFAAFGPHPSRVELIGWWSAKLEFSALIDVESGLFTDQKWVDLVPGMFPDVAILRHPGYNLAYWNLAHRGVTAGLHGELLANGEPVSFIHFSGVVLDKPEIFSQYQNRFELSSIGALRGTYLRYLDLLRSNGHDAYGRNPYAYGRLRDGTVLTPEMRAIFRHRFDVGSRQRHPDPFAIDAKDLVEPVGLAGRLSRRVLRLLPRLRAQRQVRWLMRKLGGGARDKLRSFLARSSLPPSVRAATAAARARSLGYATTRPTGLSEPAPAEGGNPPVGADPEQSAD